MIQRAEQRPPEGAGSHADGLGDGHDLRPDQLVGTWRLTDWEALGDEGDVSRPFGDGPLGYVVYTRDGRMITTISRASRAPIGGDLLAGPVGPRAAAFGSFLAYSGTFRVEGHDVVHHVEMSLFPDWVGTEQRRHAQLAEGGSVLILSTDPMPASGRMVQHCLRWERLEG